MSLSKERPECKPGFCCKSKSTRIDMTIYDSDLKEKHEIDQLICELIGEDHDIDDIESDNCNILEIEKSILCIMLIGLFNNSKFEKNRLIKFIQESIIVNSSINVVFEKCYHINELKKINNLNSSNQIGIISEQILKLIDVFDEIGIKKWVILQAIEKVHLMIESENHKDRMNNNKDV